MLRNVLFALVGISTVAVVAACKTEAVDTDNPTQSTTGTGGGSTSSGVGAQSSTGGFGGNVGGSGGGTGGSECSKEDGALTVDSCNSMTITPSTVPGGTSSATCGETLDQNPPGFDLCLRAPEIFTGGSFDFLQACLAKIGTNPEACEIEPVRACVGDMFEAACVLPFTAVNCADVAKQCTDVGDASFDEPKCNEDLKPFSADGGWKEMIECFNDPAIAGDCQTAWTTCYNEHVFTF